VCPQNIYPPIAAYIFESKFDIKKPKKYNDYEEHWKHTFMADYVQGSGKYKFPDEMYFVVTYKKYKKIDFDYFSILRKVRIVSENFLSFLNNNGIDDSYYEKAILHIIDLKGQTLTDKNYFALRFWHNKDDKDYFNLHKETEKAPIDDLESYFDALDGGTGDNVKKDISSDNSLYPDIELKKYMKGKNVFILNDFNYAETLIFTENVKDYILENFCSPEIYKAEDFPKVFDNSYLQKPENNKYRMYK
jgi:hypothetical protein